MNTKNLLIPIALASLAFATPGFSQKTWIGNGANNNWSAGANWLDGSGATAALTDYVFDADNLTGTRTTGAVNITSANIGNISFAGNATYDSFAWNTGAGNAPSTPANLQGNVTVTSGNHTGSVYLNIAGTSTWDIAAGSSFSKSGADSIGGSGTLVKAGAGTLELNAGFTGATNPWAGTMRVDAGVLRANFGNSLGNASATLQLNGGQVLLVRDANTIYNVGSVTVTANSTIAHSRSSAGAGNALTLGALSIGGGNQLTFTQSNAGGNTPTSASTLVFGATTLTGNATFNMTAGSGTNMNVISLGAVGDGGSGYAVSSAGTGRLVLTSASTFSGGISIGGDSTVELGHANAAGTDMITNNRTSNGSALEFGTSATIYGFTNVSGGGIGSGGTIAPTNIYGPTLTIGAGGLTQESTATQILELGNSTNRGMNVVLGANQTWLNNNSAAARFIRLNTGGAASIFSTLDLSTNTLTTDGIGDVRLEAPVTGTGGLTKNGTGTLQLSGTNTYTGATTVNAGTLLVLGNSSAATGNVTVASGATLAGTGTLGGATTVSGNLNPGQSPGTLNFGDSLTLTGTATLNLEITGIGVGEFDILNGDGFNTLTLAGTLALDNTGYSATVGDTISVFTNWSSITGSFADITGTDLGGGLSWDTSNLYSSGQLIVIPEPSTWALLAGSLTALMVFRRRRK